MLAGMKPPVLVAAAVGLWLIWRSGRRAEALVCMIVSFVFVFADAGYFDQSHFIREFRGITGEAPGKFFGADEHC